MPEATVYVVVLNWNGWQDTIACLETLLASRQVRLRVLVCDNSSSDDSVNKLAAWASGEIAAIKPANPRLGRLMGQVTLPVQHIRISRAEAEAGKCVPDVPLVLIDNGANLGFAAGNNVGLRFALSQSDMDYVWLLNNDTIVEPDCLANMVKRLQREGSNSVCGSMIHFFDQPDIIQAIGGNRFNCLTGCAARSEGRFTHEGSTPDTCQVESELDYISGCSMLLPRGFLEKVGLMAEDFFLYYEEIDWFTRAGGEFDICVAADARLYHREGRSIGSKSWQRPASELSDFHMFRSQLIFMRRHHRKFLAFSYAYIWAQVVKRVLRRQYRSAWAIGSLLLGKQSFST